MNRGTRKQVEKKKCQQTGNADEYLINMLGMRRRIGWSWGETGLKETLEKEKMVKEKEKGEKEREEGRGEGKRKAVRAWRLAGFKQEGGDKQICR